MKKTLAMLISLWLFIGFAVGTCNVSAAEGIAAPAFEQNPVYSGVSAETGGLDATGTVSDSAGYYADGEVLYSIIKSHLLQREGSFVIKYVTADKLGTKTARLGLIRRLFLAATEDSRSNRTDDGDYLRLAVDGYGYTGFAENTGLNSSLHYYTITMQFSYFSTATQEQQVAKAVNAFVKELRSLPLSDYQRLVRVHRYICGCTTYGTGGNKTVHSAYGALLGGQCACQGYATAFYRIARALGFPARIITSAKDGGNHAWNMVAVGGKYYYADLTWDDENIDGKTGKSELMYFLVSEKHLQNNDSAAQEHTADASFFDTAYFRRCYLDLADADDYNSRNTRLLSNCVITAYVTRTDGRIITVHTPDGRRLTRGVHYRLSPQTVLYGSRYDCLTGQGGFSGFALCRCGSGKQPAQRPKLLQREDGAQ